MKSDFRPDYRNIKRGAQWLRAMIEASEKMDAGRRDAMESVGEAMELPLLKREREPGED